MVKTYIDQASARASLLAQRVWAGTRWGYFLRFLAFSTTVVRGLRFA